VRYPTSASAGMLPIPVDAYQGGQERSWSDDQDVLSPPLEVISDEESEVVTYHAKINPASASNRKMEAREKVK
jgi:hypothetical protein